MICVAWYRPGQWQLLSEVSTDIDETYDEWLQNAQREIEKLPLGVGVKKIDIDVEELVAWCKKKAMTVDANARSQFALEKGQALFGPAAQ